LLENGVSKNNLQNAFILTDAGIEVFKVASALKLNLPGNVPKEKLPLALQLLENKVSH